MEVSSWKCVCGEVVLGTVDQVKRGRTRCPSCGAVLKPTRGHRSAPSLEETQTINLEDMARMAQNGVDVTVSGEWDTSVPEKAKDKKS